MKTFFMIFLVAVSGASTSIASDCGRADGKWFACEKTEDCVVGTDACGFPRAHNQKYAEQVKKQNDCLVPFKECASPPKEEEFAKLRALCKSGKCEVESKTQSK